MAPDACICPVHIDEDGVELQPDPACPLHAEVPC